MAKQSLFTHLDVNYDDEKHVYEETWVFMINIESPSSVYGG